MTLGVLVVEDEPLVAQAHAGYVSRIDGFEVLGTARTVQEAVRMIVHLPVDLVLLDLNMPDGDGLDLLRTVRGAGRELDILAITAVSEVQSVRTAISLGVVGYLLKPFVFKDLQARLKTYRRYRLNLPAERATSQAEVDRLLQDLHRPPGPLALPKGLSPSLLARVEAMVRGTGSSDAYSASQVADAVGTSRVTARRYLEHLAELGALERGQRLGRTGRPEITFRWRTT